MKVLVVYCSMYGHIYKMAETAAQGARSAAGVEAVLRRVPETLPHGKESHVATAYFGGTDVQPARVRGLQSFRPPSSQNLSGATFGLIKDSCDRRQGSAGQPMIKAPNPVLSLQLVQAALMEAPSRPSPLHRQHSHPAAGAQSLVNHGDAVGGYPYFPVLLVLLFDPASGGILCPVKSGSIRNGGGQMGQSDHRLRRGSRG